MGSAEERGALLTRRAARAGPCARKGPRGLGHAAGPKAVGATEGFEQERLWGEEFGGCGRRDVGVAWLGGSDYWYHLDGAGLAPS